MKVLMYGSSIYYTNLPSPVRKIFSDFVLSENNIDRLASVCKDRNVRPFLEALLHLKVNLTIHVTISNSGFASTVYYLFTYGVNNEFFLFGLNKHDREAGESRMVVLLPKEDDGKEVHDEEYWSQYFLDVLEKLYKEHKEQIRFSTMVINSLVQSGVPV